MSKPITYWGCDPNNQLIQDIAETFGDTLAAMTQSDALSLIGTIAHEAWAELDIDYPPSDEAEAVRDRLHELSTNQKIALLQALINS